MEDKKEMNLDKIDGSKSQSKETIDEKPFHYKHARASIAVDMVVFGILPENKPNSNELCVFVHRPPDESDWWLPGRFMHCGESIGNEKADDGDNWTLEDTMKSALTRDEWEVEKSISIKTTSGSKTFSKTSLSKPIYIITPNIDLICQLEAMSALNRDNRKNKRVVSIPYMTLVCIRENNSIPSELEPDCAQWMPISKLIRVKDNYTPGEERLAHDHFDILKNGLKRLFQEIRTRPIGGNVDMVDDQIINKYIDNEDRNNKEKLDDYFLLPKEFDISQLVHIYNVVLQTMGVSVERSNLRKLLLERGVIKEINDNNAPQKGGTTYKFVVEKYNEFKEYLNFGFNPKPKDKNKTPIIY